MVVGGHTSDAFSGQKFFFFAPVFIPFVILGVPMLDTGFAIVRRTLKRARGEGTKVLESGDKEHLHHRLMEMGHGHRRAVVILWAWTTILSGLVLYPIYFKRGNEIIPVGIAALALLLCSRSSGPGWHTTGARRSTRSPRRSSARDGRVPPDLLVRNRGF